MSKLISVVSGKGGTGKSLFTAVLGSCLAKEKCRVLLVDMDIHVRGLTILLSSYMNFDETKKSISDCFNIENNNKDFAVYRFQECEFIPAVRDISEPLIFSKENDYFSYLKDAFFQELKNYANDRYDLVLLDCRSGLDYSIIECVKHSDFVFAVSEDDDVCLNANMNLVNYFRHDEHISNIYTIINKGRRINSLQDIKDKIDSTFDFSCIGVIPFDERIMDDYGKERFWLSVYDTLYFRGLILAWDRFQVRTKLPYQINAKKYGINNDNVRRFINIPMLIRIYGMILVVLSALIPILTKFIDLTNLEYISVVFAIIGLLMIIVSTGTFRRFLLGKDDYPKKYE